MIETAPQESQELHSLKLVWDLGLLSPGWKEMSWLKSKSMEVNWNRNDGSHLEIVPWMLQGIDTWLYNILFPIIVMMT